MHATGPAHCTLPDCADTDSARHELRIDCRSIIGGCDCAEAEQLIAA